MKLPKHPFVRKALLLACLALAGIVVGKVFTLLTRPAAQDILAEIKATKVMEQSLYVNQHPLLAEVWQVPDSYSTDPLRKAAERLLVVGKTVYVFKETVMPLKGSCVYPPDLPMWDVQCDYVIETGNARVVIGTSSQSEIVLMEQLDAQARTLGWTPMGDRRTFVWQKDGKTLFAKVKTFPGKSAQAVLIEQKEF